MARFFHSFVHIILASATLTAAIPFLPPRWSTPGSCIRELAIYDFSQCSQDLNTLIQMARESIKDIEIIGLRLFDVAGPGSKVLPQHLPVTHNCYLRRIRDPDPEDAPGHLWTDDDFVPFRLNLQCDEQDIITAYSWH